MKLLKRISCQHKKQRYYKCDLVRTAGNKWTTKHYFKCWDCGKIIASKKER